MEYMNITQEGKAPSPKSQPIQREEESGEGQTHLGFVLDETPSSEGDQIPHNSKRSPTTRARIKPPSPPTNEKKIRTRSMDVS
ncbi:hypothetical protein TrRE_jg3610 [Triparma retinervis]|uniref:Uncharacterized protein n=1 Tax=Triparma retinervis TaxID=2557542 RepID=A0A9W6ZND7_9STRA|nr:hypothetical protein TrRE_jg3610 [Triparma retinervis]